MFDTVKRLREKSSLTTVAATSGSEATKGDEVIIKNNIQLYLMFWMTVFKKVPHLLLSKMKILEKIHSWYIVCK